jgi:hypothetical protein
MENLYKDFVIRYDSRRDDEWPRGCYFGIKYINNSADNSIRTKLCHTQDDVKNEINNLELDF